MKIKIVFFSWNSFYGKLIRFGTKCNWTHVGLVGEEKPDGYFIYEALNKGLVKNFYSHESINKFKENNNITIEELELDCDANKLKEVCESYLGKPYDWLSIFNIAYYIIFKKYALKLKGPKLLICSEFVARALYDLGFNLSEKLNKPYDYITPADIYNYMQIINPLVKKFELQQLIDSINVKLKNGN